MLGPQLGLDQSTPWSRQYHLNQQRGDFTVWPLRPVGRAYVAPPGPGDRSVPGPTSPCSGEEDGGSWSGARTPGIRRW
ncbi:hypothetical protein [Streptosporangium sp. NPDC003464]